MLGVRQACDVKKCGLCSGWLPFDRFATNPKTNELYYNCEVCRPIMAAHKRKYRRTSKGKAKEAEYKSSGEGKASEKKYKTGEVGKAATKRYKTGVAGKDASKRYKSGDAGQATAKRFCDKRTLLRQTSSSRRLDDALVNFSYFLLSGRRETSPTFLDSTGFASEAEFRSVVESSFKDGMSWENYGVAWHIDHKIPRQAYDLDNPEDVKRCWSPRNVEALTPEANLSKSWKLVDQSLAESGVENFPVSWNGVFPDQDFKNEHAARMMARNMIEEEEGDEEPSSSNGVLCESDDGEAPESD